MTAPERRRTSRIKSRTYRHFIMWGTTLSICILALTLALFSFVFARDENFYFNLAAALVVSWTLILTLYYVWAIYFYNVNGGRLAQMRFRKQNETAENPNAEETLGLPPGTVRGTLALSVLVAAMAMIIASLGMPLAMKESEVMIDHFEFLKTGFVMVIAFYFGTKSLEVLRDRKPGPAARQPPEHNSLMETDSPAESHAPNQITPNEPLR